MPPFRFKDKKKGDGPTLSNRRKKWIRKTYRSKIDPQERKFEHYDGREYSKGRTMNDGTSFSSHKCLRCRQRLTNCEFDQLGYLCYDCYGSYGMMED